MVTSIRAKGVQNAAKPIASAAVISYKFLMHMCSINIRKKKNYTRR